MMDKELRKTSVRANNLEKKRFEMLLASYDTAKRSAAMEIKKSQVDFKRRLKNYRDRQHEISMNRSVAAGSNRVEEYMVEELRRRRDTDYKRPSSHPTSTTQSLSHTAVCFRDVGHPASKQQDNRETETANAMGADTSQLEEDEVFVTLSHRRKSKVDLRPYTAWSVMHDSPKADPNSSSSSFSAGVQTYTVQLLPLKGGGLGTQSTQVRYLEEEEIEKRCSFHRLLLDKYRKTEQQRQETINHRVDQFCGELRDRQGKIGGPRTVGGRVVPSFSAPLPSIVP